MPSKYVSGDEVSTDIVDQWGGSLTIWYLVAGCLATMCLATVSTIGVGLQQGGVCPGRGDWKGVSSA